MPRSAFRRTAQLVCLAALACLLGHAQSRFECGEVPSRILRTSVKYCAFLPPSYDVSDPRKVMHGRAARSYPVLYFLHGLGDNERSLLNTGGWSLVEDLRAEHRIGEFLIITPDGGQSFYINSRDGRVRYSDFFLREFIPAMQRNYRVRPDRSARAIGGISMGGYGALRFAFAHPQMFSSVSAHSAALAGGTPQELNSVLKAGLPLGALLGELFGNPLDLNYWRENSPFFLARKNAAAVSKLKIYFDCGREDDYGFDRGARALDRQLATQKIPHEFHLDPGGHNLPYFLGHLGASIEFHSRSFKPSP